jgi:hypothetical protein
MATIAEIREGLAANLSTIPGLAESAYLLSNPTMPAAEIQPGEITYDQAMRRGLDEVMMTVRVFVAAGLDQAAQRKLDLMLAPDGDDSVKAALESDTRLGSTVDDLHVTACTGPRIFTREGMPSVLGAEWTVRVLSS